MTITSTVQFSTGKQVEAFLDDFFRRQGYTIKQTTRHQERVLCLGDRVFTSPTGQVTGVEYKSGIQSKFTGNIFLETVSVDTFEKPGWVYTCQADFILYACLLNHKILVFRPADLRARIDELKSKFKEVKTSHGQNAGYNTHGVLVPLTWAETYLAEKVLEV